MRDAESVLEAARSAIAASSSPCTTTSTRRRCARSATIIDSGRIGAVNLVTLDTFRTQHARGVAEWLPDWRRIRRYAGGGIAMDHGAHTFYLTFDWLGSHPLSITAKMSSQGAYDTEDNFTCTVTFPTGVAMARLTWNAAVRKVIYTIHGEQRRHPPRGRRRRDHRARPRRRAALDRLALGRRQPQGVVRRGARSLRRRHRRRTSTSAPTRATPSCASSVIETAYASSRAGCVEMSLSPGVHVANAVP